MTIQSLWSIALIRANPRPGIPSALSTATMPDRMPANCSPDNVMTGSTAFLNACRQSTARFIRPLALAVRM